MSVKKNSREKEQQRMGKVMQELMKIEQTTGYKIVQTNGQRVYAPPAYMQVPQPPRGSEIFIGNLPKSVYEDTLIPLFEKAGCLYKFRLMLDFFDKGRGFAFATYYNPGDANKAVQQFNGYEIRSNLKIGVFKSVDNCRLFIGNLPVHVSREEVWDKLSNYCDGIVNIIMYMNTIYPTINRGFVFVEFENHSKAAMARRQFRPSNLNLWQTNLYIDWAEPLPEVDEQIMSKVKILYVKKIPLFMSKTELHNAICAEVGPIVQKTHKINDYAFVHFINRRSAEHAKKILTVRKICGVQLSVEWSRPRKFSKRNRLASEEINLCRSVPPTMRKLVHEKIMKITTNNSGNTSASQETQGAGSSSSSMPVRKDTKILSRLNCNLKQSKKNFTGRDLSCILEEE